MEWVKLYHKYLYSQEIWAASRILGEKSHTVIGAFVEFLDFASRNDPRGSLEGINFEVFDAAGDCESGTFKRYFDVFTRVGLFKDNAIANWCEEQERPSAPSDNSAERVRKFRERQKALKHDETACNVTGNADETERNACNVTCNAVKRDVTDVTAIEEEVEVEEEVEEEVEVDEEVDVEKDLKGLKTHMSDGVGQAPEKAPKVKPIKYSEDFERFWQAYPVERREQKAAAFKGWKLWLKRGATAEQMITAAQNYGRIEHERGTERRFIKMASTFLGPSAAWQDYADGGSQLTADARRNGPPPDNRSYDEVVASLGLRGFTMPENFEDGYEAEVAPADGYGGEDSYSLRQEEAFMLSGPR